MLGDIRWVTPNEGLFDSQKKTPHGKPCGVDLAEREGFEPSVGSPLRLISSQVHSTTLPPLQIRFRLSKPIFYQAIKLFKPPM